MITFSSSTYFRFLASAAMLCLLGNLLYMIYIRKLEGVAGPYSKELNRAIFFQSSALLIMNTTLIIGAFGPVEIFNEVNGCFLDDMLNQPPNDNCGYCTLPPASCFRDPNFNPENYNNATLELCLSKDFGF